MAILRIPISDDALLDGFTGKGGVLCSWIHAIEREGDVLAVEIDDPSVADMAPVEVPLHFRLSASDLAEAVSVVSQSGITRHTSWPVSYTHLRAHET